MESNPRSLSNTFESMDFESSPFGAFKSDVASWQLHSVVWNDKESSDVNVVIETNNPEDIAETLYLHRSVLAQCQYFVSRTRWEHGDVWIFKQRSDSKAFAKTLELLYTGDYLGIDDVDELLDVLRISQELLCPPGVNSCMERIRCGLWMPDEWERIETELNRLGLETPDSLRHRQYKMLVSQQLVRRSFEEQVVRALGGSAEAIHDVEVLAKANRDSELEYINHDVLWSVFLRELRQPYTATQQGFRWLVEQCVTFKSWGDLWKELIALKGTNYLANVLLSPLFHWIVSREGWAMNAQKRFDFMTHWLFRWIRGETRERARPVMKRLFRSFPADMNSKLFDFMSAHANDAVWGEFFRDQKDRILHVARVAQRMQNGYSGDEHGMMEWDWHTEDHAQHASDAWRHGEPSSWRSRAYSSGGNGARNNYGPHHPHHPHGGNGGGAGAVGPNGGPQLGFPSSL